jgi:hypothetical protein
MLCLLEASFDSTPLEAVSGTLLSGMYPLFLVIAVSALLIGLYQSLRDHEASGMAMIIGSLMMIGMLMTLPTLITAAGGPPVSLAPAFRGLARYGPLLGHGAATLAGWITAGSVIRHLRRQRAQQRQAAAEAAFHAEQRLAFLNWLEEEFLKLQIDSLPGMTDRQRFLLDRMSWAAQQTLAPQQLEEVWRELRCALG